MYNAKVTNYGIHKHLFKNNKNASKTFLNSNLNLDFEFIFTFGVKRAVHRKLEKYFHMINTNNPATVRLMMFVK